MKKKNYNSFKMWGSWVGALFLTISTFISNSFIDGKFCPRVGSHVIVGETNEIICHTTPGILYTLQFYGVTLLIGFLIGWGIHSLVRYLRK